MFDVSLDRTGAGYFDFYLLHNLGGGRTEVFEKSGAWEFVSEMKEKGLVRHMGFSFHDTADKLDEILTAHPEAEFVQLQINYADWEDESIQSRKCYETARRHGKNIVIMEPVRGGCLATLPDTVSAIFRDAEPESSVASWAIRFAASLDGVITVLSGMSDVAQVRDNVSVINSFRPLDGRELAVIEKVRRAMSEIDQIPCTSCGYCEKGCPKKIPIPKIFASLNYQDLYNNYRSSLGSYNRATESAGRASDCISCLKCEGVCPQHIKITEHLRRAAEVFEK